MLEVEATVITVTHVWGLKRRVGGEGGREGGSFTIEIAEEDVLDAAAHTALYLADGLFPLAHPLITTERF